MRILNFVVVYNQKKVSPTFSTFVKTTTFSIVAYTLFTDFTLPLLYYPVTFLYLISMLMF